MTEERDRLLLLVCAEKHKAGEKVSIVTNWEVERVGSRAEVILDYYDLVSWVSRMNGMGWTNWTRLGLSQFGFCFICQFCLHKSLYEP